MSNIDTITERITKAADEQLKRDIAAAAKPLHDIICDGCGHYIRVPGRPLDANGKQAGGNAAPVAVDYGAAINALQELAFKLRQERRRKEALDAFMAKVDRVAREVDSIRNEIGAMED